ncbi:unnamed protein product [Lampetra planeri]
MRPKAEMPVEQQERNVGPLQLPVGEGWGDLTGCLAGLLSVAVELQATAILSPEREILPAKFESPSAASAGTLSLRKCLPTVHEFMAAGGNWTAFQRRFKASCALVGWSNEEALRALPTALDDNSLGAFEAIPEADWTTLHRACAQMAAIFDPPSNARRRFMLWRLRCLSPSAVRCWALAMQHIRTWSRLCWRDCCRWPRSWASLFPS